MGHTDGYLALGYQRNLTIANHRKLSIWIECCFLTIYEPVWCKSSAISRCLKLWRQVIYDSGVKSITIMILFIEQNVCSNSMLQ